MPVSHYSSFTADVTSGVAPLTVNFTDTSGSPPATAWLWNFGDLSPIGTTQNPAHIFSSAGVYSVVLDANTGVGFGNPSLPTLITVTAPPGTDYTLTPAVAGDETRVTNITAFTNVHVPTNAAQPGILPGMIFIVTKISAGPVNIVPDFGVTINSAVPFTLNNVGDTIRLIKVAANEWDMQSWSGSAITLPNTEVAYGSPSNAITSTPDFTYNDVTGVLAVGPTAIPSLVTANTGQSITVEGDTGARFKSGANTFGINSSGAVLVNASAGTTGQVLTSSGSGSPALWSTAGGAPPTFAARLLGTGTSTMNRSMYSTWTAVVIKTSTEASWSVGPSEISLAANGFWRITVVGYADPGPGGSWPNDSTVYGTYVSAALPYNQTSQYARSAVSGFPTSWSFLGSNAQKASWTDEFIVEVTAQPLAFPIALFAENYSGSPAVQYHAMVTAQRIV